MLMPACLRWETRSRAAFSSPPHTHDPHIHSCTCTNTCTRPPTHSANRPPGSGSSVLRTFRDGWALTEAAARWARSTVWSRSFTVKSLADGARNVVAMVPVLDMIDHNPSMEVVWHTGPDGQETFQFCPLQPIPKVSGWLVG